jgi:uncharacterized protein involved in response to NO
MAVSLKRSMRQEDGVPRPALSPAEVFEIARQRELSLSRLLVAYISSGVVFMLLPGTFLGVWNLLHISGGESVASVSPAWIQAHGHAQVFGWIGSFILGIGFYSLRGQSRAGGKGIGWAWVCWVMWTVGVGLRWFANVYRWEWRVLLPVSGVLELAAFLIFFLFTARHRPEDFGRRGFEPWIWVVIGATTGLLLTLVANLASAIYVAWSGTNPGVSHLLDQRYLALMTWGFLVPFVWGFSARWMEVFLGLRPIRQRLLVVALAVDFLAVGLTLVDWGGLATLILVAGVALAIIALRMFEPAVREPKIRGVHASFPAFVRMAYGWLIVAALLGVAADRWDGSGGIWGASRHALTVGFVAVMVFSVGQRILPAFAGMRLLWSSKLMFAGLALITFGCTLRVSSEIIAYQGYAEWAWSVLPISALFELAGVTAFAMNILGTFLLQPSHVAKQPLVVQFPGGIPQSSR